MLKNVLPGPYTVEDWERVIWNDECSVEKSKNPHDIWVFRTPYEKWEKDCINGVRKGPDVKLMVWACFWGNKNGLMVPIMAESFNRWEYIDSLKSSLLPTYRELNHTIGDPVFMQDNARVYTAGAVIEF